MKRFFQPGSLPGVLASFFILAGCTTGHYRKSADKEAYGVIAQKTPLVKNMDEQLTIEQTNQLSLEGSPVRMSVEEFLGPDGERERGAHILSLEKALHIGINHSRFALIGCRSSRLPHHHIGLHSCSAVAVRREKPLDAAISRATG